MLIPQRAAYRTQPGSGTRGRETRRRGIPHAHATATTACICDPPCVLPPQLLAVLIWHNRKIGAGTDFILAAAFQTMRVAAPAAGGCAQSDLGGIVPTPLAVFLVDAEYLFVLPATVAPARKCLECV